MKKSIILISLIFTIFRGYSQSDCVYDPTATARTACHSCENFTRNIPTTSNYTFGPVSAATTPTKTIRCIIHVIQKEAPSSPENFQNTTQHKSIIADRFTVANSVFSSNTQLSNQGTCSSIFLNDSRIRLSITKYVFHQNNTYHNSGNYFNNCIPVGSCDFYNQFVANYSGLTTSEKENNLHVFILGCRTISSSNPSLHCTPGGYASGIPSSNEKYIILNAWYHFLLGAGINQGKELEISQNIVHEVGHAIGLFHTYQYGDDYLCDTYQGSSAQTNNVMDIKVDQQKAFSQGQIERMHYFLLGHAGDTYKINASSVSKPTPAIAGQTVLCSTGADYYVSNHQLGTVVSWSVSPTSAVQVASGNGSTAHLVPSTYKGSATIT